MSDEWKVRVRELAKRAGLDGVDPMVFVAVCVLCALACVWALWRWWPWSGGGESVVDGAPTFDSVEETAAPSDATAPAGVIASVPAAPPAQLVIHVVGAVRHPGVYTLGAGARAADAVEAAGGLLADAVVTGVNLARIVTDGEQVFVPDEDAASAVGAAASAPAAAASGAGAPAGAGVPGAPTGTALVDLNSADAAALETLPGVGPSTAAKIIADRESNGPFSAVEDLRRVSGIGEKKLEGLKDFACVR